MEQSERILATLQRDLNCLVDPDRSTRRRALERLQKQLLQGEANNSPAYLADLQVAWDDTILKKVLKALCDSVEKCRELAIHLINGVVNKISKVDQTVALVVPLIAERMGQLPLLEKSEEVRLEMINFLGSECMRRCSGDTLKLVVGHLIQGGSHRFCAFPLEISFMKLKKVHLGLLLCLQSLQARSSVKCQRNF